MDIVRRTRDKNSKLFMCVSIFLFIFMFVRMYSFLGNTSFQKYNLWLLLLGEVLCILAILPALGRIGRVFQGSTQKAALVLWIWMCISTIINEGNALLCVQHIITQSFWMISFVFFSVYFVGDNRANEIFIKKLAVVFLVLSGVYYMWWIMSGGDKYASGAVNTVYYCILLFPLVFSVRSKLVRILIVAIVIAAVLCSGKRTAFVAIGLAVLVPLLISEKGKKKNRTAKILLAAGVVFFAFVLYVLIDNIFEITLFDRLGTMVEDDGSGRGYIFSEVLRNIELSSARDKILGSGFNAVASDKIVILFDEWEYSIEYTSAHNDFLEVLYDYGIIGLLLFVTFLVQVIRTGYKMYMTRNPNFKLYLSAFIIYITMSLTSHLILYPTYIMFMMMFFSMSTKKRRKN